MAFGPGLVLLGLVWSEFGPVPRHLRLLAVQTIPSVVVLPHELLLWHVSMHFWPIPTVSGTCGVSKRPQMATEKAGLNGSRA